MEIERRAASELRAVSEGGSPRLVGLAAPYGVRAELPGFVEVIMKGAFRRSLQSNSGDVIALLEHDTRSILGRKSSGTLSLTDSERGLEFSIRPPNTTAGMDALESVRRGDLRGCSFGFRVNGEDGESWDLRDGVMIRELRDIDLVEVSLVALPAYGTATDVSVAMRSMSRVARAYPHRLAAIRRFLETCA